MKKIPLSKGLAVLVDEADFDELSRYKWHFYHGYAARMVREGKKRVRLRMHHALIGRPPAGMVTDHENMNKLDNRRENLRFVSKAMNTYNRPPRSDSRCVYWYKGKWNIRFTVQNKTLYFGRFDDEAEARSIAALLKGALIYHELTKGDSIG